MAPPVQSLQSKVSKSLLRDIGEAVFYLNTVVVGLDAVEKGYDKPEKLDVSWNPEDRVSASRKSRKFIVESTMVSVCESLYEHMFLVSKFEYFKETIEKWNSDTSKSDKVWDIYSKLLGESYVVCVSVLLSHWRNRIVHRKSSASLNGIQKRIIRNSEDEIFEKYKKLNVDCLLCHFEERRPTLKDASCIIAMVINMVKQFDDMFPDNISKSDLDVLLKHYGLREDIEKIQRETSGEKIHSSVIRAFHTKAPFLLDSYMKHYPE